MCAVIVGRQAYKDHDWEKGWLCTQTFEGHSHYVMQVVFNPEDTRIFATASLDATAKIWNLSSPAPVATLTSHSKGLNCVDFFMRDDKLYLLSGSDDFTIKVWDCETKSCIQTLEGHTHNVTSCCVNPQLRVIITTSEDKTIRLWDATTYRNALLQDPLSVVNKTCFTAVKNLSHEFDETEKNHNTKNFRAHILLLEAETSKGNHATTHVDERKEINLPFTAKECKQILNMMDHWHK